MALPITPLRSSVFFGGDYRVFYVHYHVICKQWQFCFLLSSLDAFYFSCLIAMASNAMLNRSGENRHLCLVPDLSGKSFSFCPLSMMLAVGLSYMAFIMWRNAPFIPTLLSVFIRNVCCVLSNAFSASIDTIVIFCLSFWLCDVLCLLICEYCILVSLGWIPLGHGVWSF